MRQTFFKQQFIGLFILTAILFGNFSAFAQRRGGAAKTSVPGGQTTAAATNQKKETKKECKGNYSGQVTYNRTIKQSHSGRYGSTYQRTYIYQSTIPIRDDGSTQGSIYPQASGIGGSFNFYGKADATMTESVNDLQISEKDDYCKLTLKGAQGKTRVQCKSLWTRKAEASGSGDVNVFLGFNGNKYKISLDNPKVDGTSVETSKSSCSGTCGKDTPIDSSRSGFIKGEKQNGSYTDEQTFDPTNFNRLSGSFTRTSGDETVTITWNLARCAPPLMINDLAFEVHRYPDATTWHGIDPLQGTIDGNLVKLKANVFNGSGETSYATVKFTDTTTGEMLPDGSISVAVKPGETRDVEYEWDTSGFAWDENQKPTLARKIKAEVDGDSIEKKIIMIPKPVINVHGLWSNAAAWADWHNYLREAHSLAWEAFPVGEVPENGKMSTGEAPGNYRPTNTIYQNARELEKQIRFVQKTKNAWHVDIVAHSMGGLISRQYINSFMNIEFDRRPTVSHLVMLGTPNQGSPCADLVNEVFEENGHKNMEAMRELKPIIVRAFNQRITDRKQVKFSILVGTPIPFTCQTGLKGDGVVPIQSALWTVSDHDYASRNHIELTGIEDFKGFVMPRIAVGPKKAQAEMYIGKIENQRQDYFAMSDGEVYQKENRGGFNQYFRKASYKNGKSADETDDRESLKNVTVKRQIELAANQTREIEIPVTDGNYAGALLVGTPAVSATLTDANGALLGKSEGGMAAVGQMFRTIGVEKPVTKGVWKLKLENLGNEPTVAFIAGFAGNDSSANFSVEAGKPNAAGQIPLTAKWLQNNSPVLNAKITANIVGQKSAIEFFDDGKHGDNAAGDGIYGASTEKLSGGDYTIEARAEANNQNALAIANFKIGGGASGNSAKTPATKPAKTPATKPRRKN